MEEKSKASNLISIFNAELETAKEYRQPYEDMWLSAYRAFYNTYEPDILSQIPEEASRLYMGVTRQKCIGAWQRICDILFSQTEKPYTVEPSPVPNISNSRAIKALVMDMPPEMQQMVRQQPQILFANLDEKTLKKIKRKVAEKAAKKMKRQIDDVWLEDNIAIKFKHAILEAVICGSCVLKVGTTERDVAKWTNDVKGQYSYNPQKSYSPTVKYVSIFDVWFDPETKLIIDNGFVGSCDYTFERHVMSQSELLELTNMPYFDTDAIYRVIKEGCNHTELPYESDKRSILNQNVVSGSNRWDVWERWGNIKVSDLRDAGFEPGEVYKDEDLVHGNIWFCNNEVIKFVVNPNKPPQVPYQVMPYEITPGELYGFGIPFKMQDSQQLLNSSMRLFIDNKVDAAGPVFFINEDRWTLDESPSTVIRPWGSVPLAVAPGETVDDVVSMRVIPDVSNPMIPLFELAKNMADEESGVPAFAHGAQNPDLIRATGGTASGMSMVLNIYDLGIKTVVKNIDDFLVQPIITKIYNWFMQYSDDESIKGDMQVIARGTIGLMAKEVKSQRLTQLLGQTANPIDLQMFDRQQLWLDTLESIDLDPKRYTHGQRQPMAGPPQPVQGQPGVQAPPGPPKPGPGVGVKTPMPVGGQ